MIYAVFAIILYVIAVISAAWYFVKKDSRALLPSIVCAVEFLVFLYIANVTGDPLPYWETMVAFGLVTMGGIGALEYPEYIATKVKEKMVPEEIELRRLSFSDARKEIEEYLKRKKEKIWLEDVINDLKIEPEMVVRVVKQLEREGKIK